VADPTSASAPARPDQSAGGDQASSDEHLAPWLCPPNTLNNEESVHAKDLLKEVYIDSPLLLALRLDIDQTTEPHRAVRLVAFYKDQLRCTPDVSPQGATSRVLAGYRRTMERYLTILKATNAMRPQEVTVVVSDSE
jgi:hypothetical protein